MKSADSIKICEYSSFCPIEEVTGIIKRRWYLFLLSVIYKNGSVRFAELLHFSGLKSTPLTRVLRLAERSGHVERQFKKDQVGLIVYVMTEEGKKYVESLVDYVDFGLRSCDRSRCKILQTNQLDCPLLLGLESVRNKEIAKTRRLTIPSSDSIVGRRIATGRESILTSHALFGLASRSVTLFASTKGLARFIRMHGQAFLREMSAKKIKVKIFVPNGEAIENTDALAFKNVLFPTGFSDLGISLLIVDKKKILIMKVGDDTQINPYDAIHSSTYLEDEIAALLLESMLSAAR